jgi:hypothetical protein
MFARRLLVLVAVLMGLTALAASLAPPPPAQRGRSPSAPSATPTPHPAATPAPAAGTAPEPGATVRARISASRSAVPRDVRAAEGDLVDLVVSGDVVDTVEIPGQAVLEPIDPDSPALVQLYADTPGRFPILLLDANRRIGTLLVSG